MRGEGCGVRGEGCKGEREKGHSSVTEPIEAACIVRGSEDCVSGLTYETYLVQWV